LRKFVAYIPDGHLFDAKYALLQFAGVVSDERHLVAIETEADMEDVESALAKTGLPYALFCLEKCMGRNADADLSAVAALMSER